MANIDRFMIAPLNSGQQTDLKPFMIPDDAFAELTNAYIFRGRVRKRFGSQLMNQSVADSVKQLYSRLRIEVATTAAVTGNLAATIMPGAIWKIGQMFSVGSTMFTVYQANGATWTTGAATATYNTATGSLVITGNSENPSTKVYFYPTEPVMGLLNYNALEVSNEPLIAFDTQFAYQFNGTAWGRIGAAVWTGTDSEFFTGCNWRGVDANDFLLYVTNFHHADFIKYWNGTTWTDLNPAVNAGGTVLDSARLIVTFKGRLLVLNTFETTGVTTAQFPNRCRFSQNGTPLITGDPNAWKEDIPGKGGFIDAAVNEQIVSCAFIKDRLIVYFEKSTWELAYTGNQILPFYWNRINQELGCESTNSAIPFDKVVLGMGSTGVNACNGANVERVDQKIPDSVFELSNVNNGLERVCGIRDYFNQMVYWAFPSKYVDETYPNRVLVYNYLNGSWAIFEDSITAFGYYQPQTGLTWATWTTPWEQCVAPWNSAQSGAKFRFVVAGNQQGYVFLVNNNVTSNAPVLQITEAYMPVPGGNVKLIIKNHNLADSDYIQITNVQGSTGLNNKIYKIDLIVGADEVWIEEASFTGAYKGGGTVERVSNINILTKQYNFYIDEGRNAYISKVDFLVDRTEDGQVTVDCFIGSSVFGLIDGAQTSGAILGTAGILETFPYALIPSESQQEQLWHPIYPMADGQSIQLKIYMSDAQIVNGLIAFSDFQLHAMTFYATPTASRMQ